MRAMKRIAAVVISLSLAACQGSPPEPKKDKTQPAGSAKAGAKPGTKPGAAKSQPPVAVKAKGPFPESTHAAMKDPAQATEQAPDTFKAKFETTAGDFTIACTRDWAPNGVDRLYNLLKIGFYNDVALFRVVQGFVVQWGIHGNPEVSKHWRSANIPPDEVKESNKRGYLTYAMAGRPDTRSTQLFINYKDNSNLDRMGFAPICKVTAGMESTVDKIYNGYGAAAGKDQSRIQTKGNGYIRRKYPKMDYIKKAYVLDGDGAAGGGGKAEGAGGGAAKKDGDAAAEGAGGGGAKKDGDAKGADEKKGIKGDDKAKGGDVKNDAKAPQGDKSGGGKGDGQGSGKRPSPAKAGRSPKK